MVIKQYHSTRKDGVRLYKSYSDRNLYIKKIGTEEIYDEAIDVETAPFRYEETDKEIEQQDESI